MIKSKIMNFYQTFRKRSRRPQGQVSGVGSLRELVYTLITSSISSIRRNAKKKKTTREVTSLFVFVQLQLPNNFFV